MSNHRLPEASNRLVIAWGSYPEARKALSAQVSFDLATIRSLSPSTASDRFALDVGADDGMPRRGRSSVLGLLDQVTHRPPAHLAVREGHGGEGRPEMGGDELLVIEADDRDIVGDAETPLLERLVGSYGRRRVRDPDQLCGVTVPASRGAVAVSQQRIVEG
jgi:hypothetical protein